MPCPNKITTSFQSNKLGNIDYQLSDPSTGCLINILFRLFKVFVFMWRDHKTLKIAVTLMDAILDLKVRIY